MVRDEHQLRYLEAVAYQQSVEDQIDQLEQVRAAEKLALRDVLCREEVAVDTVIRGWTFDHRLRNFGELFARQLDQVRRLVAARQEKLVEAEREVKVLDKLEERLCSRYDAAASRAEQHVMDELAARVHLSHQTTGRYEP